MGICRARPSVGGEGPVQPDHMNLVWHRADLRTHDHPALHEALEVGPAVGLVNLDPHILEPTSPRRRAWFYANTQALREAYARRGGTLLVRYGSPWEVLPRVAAELGAQRVFAIASYTPYGRYRDGKTEAALGGRIRWYGGNYVHPPGALLKPDGGAYTVYTPYAKRWWGEAEGLSPGFESPPRFPGLELPAALELGQIPQEPSDVPLPPPGEDAALRGLEAFLRERLPTYHLTRDRLDGTGGSRLSPYFTLGVLSPRRAVDSALRIGGEGARKWVAELAWRDFSADLLYHRPQMLRQSFDPRWEGLPWVDDPELFQAWGAGETGIPLVDAGMRELRATGFLSNRARMGVAQFAVKLALLPWQKAEAHFKHLLLDGDTANNLQGWQWAGGLGVDAAPYFRVFNPLRQALSHDPQGEWLERWVPESGGDPGPYKGPVIDLEGARQRYLAAAKRIAGTR